MTDNDEAYWISEFYIFFFFISSDRNTYTYRVFVSCTPAQLFDVTPLGGAFVGTAHAWWCVRFQSWPTLVLRLPRGSMLMLNRTKSYKHLGFLAHEPALPCPAIQACIHMSLVLANTREVYFESHYSQHPKAKHHEIVMTWTVIKLLLTQYMADRLNEQGRGRLLYFILFSHRRRERMAFDCAFVIRHIVLSSTQHSQNDSMISQIIIKVKKYF